MRQTTIWDFLPQESSTEAKPTNQRNTMKFESPEEILEILNSVGETQVFEQSHKYFNTGKTDFNDHKEFLFLTKKYD